MKQFFLLTILFISSTLFSAFPFGKLEQVDKNGGFGWAYDDDAKENPIDVHIYLDGKFYQVKKADQKREDLVSNGTLLTPNHGYTFTLPTLSPGLHWIDVYAIDQGTTHHNTKLLGSTWGIYIGDTTTINTPQRDLFTDSWVATDSLGRTLPQHKDVGNVKKDKFVGLFYWIWFSEGNQNVYDISKILATPEENRKWGPLHIAHYWSEPELGYYVSSDPYIYQKHARELANAGVDVIIFDTSNTPFTWPQHYMKLCEVSLKIRREGGKTPQIAFLAPFWDPNDVVTALYNNLYKTKLFPSLIFKWKGKPLIMADSSKITNPEIRNFFTFRKPEPSYYIQNHKKDEWGWLEIYPQRPFYNSEGTLEQVVVGVAQNGTNTELKPMSLETGIHGRSWHNGAKDTRPNAVDYGFNFQEQWDRAISLNPEFIFITGWNEWIAGRYDSWQGVSGGYVFPDEYNQEYSRDIEPMKGGFGDNYYYQMISNIRKFKGIKPREKVSNPKTITIDGNFNDWNDVSPEFRDAIGDVEHRDFTGWTNSLHYTNNSGRNDIITSKVTYDKTNIYFYVETAQKITPYTDKDWMILFIDTDQNGTTGWHGYEYAVNTDVKNSDTTNIINSTGKIIATTKYKVSGNKMELLIPRSLIGETTKVSFDFHWADNTNYTFAIDGDNAPDRKFNYRFIATYDKPCEKCLNGYKNCAEACQTLLGKTGICKWPDSTDFGQCCYCFDEISDEDSISDADLTDEDAYFPDKEAQNDEDSFINPENETQNDEDIYINYDEEEKNDEDSFIKPDEMQNDKDSLVADKDIVSDSNENSEVEEEITDKEKDSPEKNDSFLENKNSEKNSGCGCTII